MGTQEIKSALSQERERLLASLSITPDWGVEGLRTFMESHVWAVWDFMSLVKSLQRDLTVVDVPWVPKGDPKVRRFINEIVWGEESDVDRHGQPNSHFEMYLSAMQGIGADTQPIERFIAAISAGEPLYEALRAHAPSDAVFKFVAFTFDIINQRKTHLVASVFTFGREDLIPDMFLQMIDDLVFDGQASTEDLRYYLERHIEVDGGEHGPIALQLVAETIGDSQERWREAQNAALEALRLRRELWEDIQNRIAHIEHIA
jgi:hypothetical protein